MSQLLLADRKCRIKHYIFIFLESRDVSVREIESSVQLQKMIASPAYLHTRTMDTVEHLKFCNGLKALVQVVQDSEIGECGD
jgi:hypothetical protein